MRDAIGIVHSEVTCSEGEQDCIFLLRGSIFAASQCGLFKVHLDGLDVDALRCQHCRRLFTGGTSITRFGEVRYHG